MILCINNSSFTSSYEKLTLFFFDISMSYHFTITSEFGYDLAFGFSQGCYNIGVGEILFLIKWSRLYIHRGLQYSLYKNISFWWVSGTRKTSPLEKSRSIRKTRKMSPLEKFRSTRKIWNILQRKYNIMWIVPICHSRRDGK